MKISVLIIEYMNRIFVLKTIASTVKVYSILYYSYVQRVSKIFKG